MRIAIMQPYFFPYLGYFQLMHAVDVFVLLDDVNYINKGWINRNRIIQNDKDTFITLKLLDKSQNKVINELRLFEAESTKRSILNSISNSYAKTSYFHEVYPILEEVILEEENNLSEYLYSTIKKTNEFLGIKTQLMRSSEIDKEKRHKGENRLLHISKVINADTYINLSGGKALYDKKRFSEAGIVLQFIQQNDIRYMQPSSDFIPYLSIIDTLLSNGFNATKQLLKEYSLS